MKDVCFHHLPDEDADTGLDISGARARSLEATIDYDLDINSLSLNNPFGIGGLTRDASLNIGLIRNEVTSMTCNVHTDINVEDETHLKEIGLAQFSSSEISSAQHCKWRRRFIPSSTGFLDKDVSASDSASIYHTPRLESDVVSSAPRLGDPSSAIADSFRVESAMPDLMMAEGTGEDSVALGADILQVGESSEFARCSEVTKGCIHEARVSYDGVEHNEAGTGPEGGYLAVKQGEYVRIMAGAASGHSGNIHKTYCYVQNHYSKQGWIPVDILMATPVEETVA